MNAILDRNARDARPVELRRLVKAFALIAVLAAVWHFVRGPLTIHLAGSSIGCKWREALLVDAVKTAGFVVPSGETIYTQRDRLPRYVFWREAATADDSESQGYGSVKTIYLDDRFQLMGRARTAPMNYSIEDIDGDGGIELTGEFDDWSDIAWSIAVRVLPDCNEVFKLTRLDLSMWFRRGKKVWFARGDSGTRSCSVYDRNAQFVLRDGRYEPRDLHLIATFEFDPESRLMKPTFMEDGCGLTVWTPPDGKPYRFDSDETIQEVAQRLLPNPMATDSSGD